MNPGKQYRVTGYVDGFNLYFGLRDSGLRRYYWLDIQRLLENLLRHDQRLVHAKYFTSRISGPSPGYRSPGAVRLDAKRKRQSDLLEAVATRPDVTTFFGHYLDKPVQCYSCGSSWVSHEEKMTDVNIATEMLTDAFEDRFDTALLISGDSDLVPAVRTLQRLFSNKRVVVAFPPRRSSVELKRFANASFIIGRAKLAKSQFPDTVTKSDGHVLQRPVEWR